MRAARNAIAANWHWFMAVYAVSALLAWAFGWAGYCLALVLAFALRHRIRAFSRAKRFGLRSVEAWYFRDDVLDRIEPANADDAGRRA